MTAVSSTANTHNDYFIEIPSALPINVMLRVCAVRLILMELKIKKAGIVCCSNGNTEDRKEQNHILSNILSENGIEVMFSNTIYAKHNVFSGTAVERAESLMQFYADESIDAIFDISGGDIGNEVIEYLDFDVIANSGKKFWGYSDLTTILNAIYKMTGHSGVLYQIKNIIYDISGEQSENFNLWNKGESEKLFEFPYKFIQGDAMHGIVVGGNIRCLLKLAGTPYFPDVDGKILLLEACGGLVPQMTAYLTQLRQMGVFSKVSGILLGTFTKMQEVKCEPSICDLVLNVVPSDLPVAKTEKIGHGFDSRAIRIGEYLHLT